MLPCFFELRASRGVSYRTIPHEPALGSSDVVGVWTLGVAQSARVGGSLAGDKAPAAGGGQTLAVGDGAQGSQGLGRVVGAGDVRGQSSSLSQSPGNALIARLRVASCQLACHCHGMAWCVPRSSLPVRTIHAISITCILSVGAP